MDIKQRLNVSGYRGIWGDNLNPKIVRLYTRAFVSFLKEKDENPTILIGRDGRESGPEIKELIKSELNNLGVRIIDGDILPTPTILFSVRKNKYSGGIIITASHNPIEYNGLKFVNNKGLFTIKEEVESINKYFETELKKDDIEVVPLKEVQPLCERKETPNFIKDHIEKILDNINVEKIREKKFKIAVDMINASACVIDPYLFENLGIEFVSLNNIPNGKFGHKPEPLKENLEDISKLVIKERADIGFAHDPDADRLVVIDENGEVVSEEFTLALAIENVLSKNKGRSIVINLSTSQKDKDIAEKYNGECFRTKIGEGFVVDGIIKHNAIIGGEGNGGVIYPTINIARDSFVGIALILELLAERGKTITEIISEMPKYYIKKDKMPVDQNKNINEVYDKLKDIFTEAKNDDQDGLRLDFKNNSWIHLRPSNTEPIIRLFGEAKNEDEIESLFNKIRKII